MNGFLLDTVILSELRKPKAHYQVTGWFQRQDEKELFISAISLGEIWRGIAKAERQDAAFANELSLWAIQIERDYGKHIIPFDAEASRIWGKLSFKMGHDSLDLQIAATALSRELTVATRNIRHFAPTGVRMINPWEE